LDFPENGKVNGDMDVAVSLCGREATSVKQRFLSLLTFQK